MAGGVHAFTYGTDERLGRSVVACRRSGIENASEPSPAWPNVKKKWWVRTGSAEDAGAKGVRGLATGSGMVRDDSVELAWGVRGEILVRAEERHFAAVDSIREG